MESGTGNLRKWMLFGTTTTGQKVKLVAVIEASTVTGPAKNLVEFCRHTRELAHSRFGFSSIETSFITFSRGDRDLQASQPAPFVAAARQAGIPVDIISERFRFDPRARVQLREIVNRRSPDIIQTHNVKSHFLLRQSGICNSIPWLAFHHGYTATDLKMRVYNQLDRWSLRAAARILTVSRAFALDIARAGAPSNRISVLHNAIDPGAYAHISDKEVNALRTRLGVAGGESVVLAVGRLSREKGHLDLLYAFDRLCKLNPSERIKLIIVGCGPEGARLEKTASALGLGRQVIFAGQVSDVKPFYRMSSALALPSHTEGSPNVLLEAMAARLPIAATLAGGVPEIVSHRESALLVEPRDRNAMGGALDLLLKNRELAQGLARNAYDRVLRNHAPEARLAALLEIYSRLLPGADLPEADLSDADLSGARVA